MLDLPAVLESRLTGAAAARVPAGSAPAPWDTRLQAVVWWHRAAPGASAHLPAELRGRRTLPITVGALIRYLDTPVGPYGEVLASPVLLAEAPLAASHIAFIAVDSPASVHGGRANWSLPKVLGRFAWSASTDHVAGPRAFAVTAEGDEAAAAWTVRAVVRPRRRALPALAPLSLGNRQPSPGGGTPRTPVTMRGRLHPASVEVDTSGPTLPAWLRAGRHAAVLLPDARATFGAPV